MRKLHTISFFGRTLCKRAVSQVARSTECSWLADCAGCKRELKKRARFPSRRAYSVVLTREERNAIDWIGGRYAHGSDLRGLLTLAPGVIEVVYDAQPNPDDGTWCDSDYRGDIGFIVPESVAWEINRLLEGSSFECFSDALASKLDRFSGSVV